MLISCNYCGKKARVISRYTISADYSKLYCRCTNSDCNHKFSMLLTFDSTLQPPFDVTQKIIIETALSVLKNLPKKERQLVLDGL